MRGAFGQQKERERSEMKYRYLIPAVALSFVACGGGEPDSGGNNNDANASSSSAVQPAATRPPPSGSGRAVFGGGGPHFPLLGETET